MLKYRFTQALVLAAFLLLLMGGLVTSTDSGLAVPDWPLSYGGFFPPMVGGIRFEHTHRLIAATVGLLTLILTLWIGKTERRASVRWLAIACLGAVVLQGILGGMTVLYKLPAPISIAHACMGPVFFSLVTALAVLTAPYPDDLKAQDDVRHLSKVVILAVFLQILLGAILRHTGQAVWLHIVWAFVVLAAVVFTASRNWSREALFLGFLVTVEFFLGIGAFLFTRIEGVKSGVGHIVSPTLHQTLGAVILATAVVLAMRLNAKPALSPRGRPCDAGIRA